MFLLNVVYDNLKIKKLWFYYLRMSLLYLNREQVILHAVCCVAPPWFYRSPDWTNQTLALKRAFAFFIHAQKGGKS